MNVTQDLKLKDFRIQVVGTSCSGKSTFSKELSEILKIPYIELDALHWGPNWQEADTDTFQARILDAIKGESWVVDGSYGRKVGNTISQRRNCIIWIDISFLLILFRFFKRSLTRWWTQEPLWGGCKETLRNSIFSKDSLLVWILSNHQPSRKKYLALLQNPPDGVSIVRLNSSREIEEFLKRAQGRL